MHKGRLDEASAKTQLLSLPDRELAVFVERYAEKLNTRVFRTCKEIANKCFEAVMAIQTRKSIGYGRNPQEANINCLKKLAQAIFEQQQGIASIEDLLEKKGFLRANYTTNSGGTTKPVCSELQLHAKPPVDQFDVSKENPVRLSLNDSKFDLKSKNPFTNKTNIHSKSTSKVSQSKEQQSPFAENAHKKASNSRINRQGTLYETSEQLLLKEQLSKAHAYIEKLEAQLKCFAEQNKYLRESISEKTEARRNRIVTETQKHTALPYYHEQPVMQHATAKADFQQGSYQFKSCANNDASFDADRPGFTDECLNGSFRQEKKRVPRLNLKMLPNYHGNSNKSLNQSLLMTYEKTKKK